MSSDRESLRLSLVFPAYNEGDKIVRSLETVLKFCREELQDFEVLVVDDGSKDNTAELAASVDGVRLLRNEVNMGKGKSVRRGMLEADGDVVLFSDVDLATPIEETLPLLRAIEDGADVAIASRHLRGDRDVKRTPFRNALATAFRVVVKVLVLRGIHDTQCGFKMFRRHAAREVFVLQRLDGWAFDVSFVAP
ncbi:MAG: glycosyltransferase [Planctomycetota bacterium]